MTTRTENEAAPEPFKTVNAALAALADNLADYASKIEAHNRDCDPEETISAYYIKRANEMEAEARAAILKATGGKQ